MKKVSLHSAVKTALVFGLSLAATFQARASDSDFFLNLDGQIRVLAPSQARVLLSNDQSRKTGALSLHDGSVRFRLLNKPIWRTGQLLTGLNLGQGAKTIQGRYHGPGFGSSMKHEILDLARILSENLDLYHDPILIDPLTMGGGFYARVTLGKPEFVSLQEKVTPRQRCGDVIVKQDGKCHYRKSFRIGHSATRNSKVPVDIELLGSGQSQPFARIESDYSAKIPVLKENSMVWYDACVPEAADYKTTKADVLSCPTLF